MLRASAAAASAAAAAVAPPPLPRRRRQPRLSPLAGSRATGAAAARGAAVQLPAPSNRCSPPSSPFCHRIGPLPCSSPFHSRRGGSCRISLNATEEKRRQGPGETWSDDGFDEEATTTTTAATPLLAKPRLVDLLPPEPPAPPRIVALLSRVAPFLASQELLQRIAVTVLAIAVIRIGGSVPVPEARQAFDAAGRVAAEAAASAASAAVSSFSSSSSSSAAAATTAATEAAAAAASAAAASFPVALGEVFGHGRGASAAAALGVLALGIGPSVSANVFVLIASLKVPGISIPFIRDYVQQSKREGREGVASVAFWTNLLGSGFALLVGLQAAARVMSWARDAGIGAAAEGAASAVAAALSGRSGEAAAASAAAESAANAAAEAAAAAFKANVPAALSARALLSMGLTLAAGACLVHFVADQISDRGLGNSGHGLFISLGFASDLAASLAAFWPAALLAAADATPALAVALFEGLHSLPAAAAAAAGAFFRSPSSSSFPALAASAAGAASSLLISLAPALALARALAPAVAGSAALLFAGLFVSQLEVRLPLVVYRRRRLRRGEMIGGEGGGGGEEEEGEEWDEDDDEEEAVGPAANAAEAERRQLRQLQQQQRRKSSINSIRGPLKSSSSSSLSLAALSPSLASGAGSMPVRLAPGGMSPLLTASMFVSLVPLGLSVASRPAAAAVAAWLARPLVGPLAMASLILLFEAASAAGSEGPKEAAEWMSVAETGLVGVPPGEATAAALRRAMGAARLAGAALLAGLYLAACALDAWCALPAAGAGLGVAAEEALSGAAAQQFAPLARGASAAMARPSSVALLMVASFVTAAERQARSLVQLPRLAAELAAERAELRAMLLEEDEGMEVEVEEEEEEEEVER